MSSRDKKPAKPSGSRPGGIRTLSDLNRSTAHDSDSDSDGPQEYYTGGEKSDMEVKLPPRSGMLVQDPSKGKDVDAIFDQARQQGAVQGPMEDQPSASSRSFTGTGRLLSGETVPTSPQQPGSVVHNIVFWRNGFTSIGKSECPKELEPLDRKTAVHVNLIKRNENYPEPAISRVPFQGVGRTLGSSSSSSATDVGPTEGHVASAPPPSSSSSPSMGLVVDESKPSTSIQLRLADGARMVVQLNHHHTIADIRSFIDSSRPGGPRPYQLQAVGFPPKILSDLTLTVEQAGLLNSVVIQKL
ncbi:CDC48-interacting UBX-domain protein [Striga asiatica]|uniref:CDC48-interacting UBX-domain protein n=1 Tax=Striga asiatica TaxID=4170 RepID=A0A5A7QII8_STRAF|nr:CDC48-interacting UBX-domain protein [Striga asiatica]